MASLAKLNATLWLKSRSTGIILFLLLVVSIILAFFVLKFPAVYQGQAQTSFEPLDVRVANLTKNSLTIVYRTDQLMSTSVIYSKSDATSGTPMLVTDILGTKSLYTHLAQIDNLFAGNTYRFQIGKYVLNQTMPAPGTYLPGQAKVIMGALVDPGNKSLTDTVVVLQTKDRFFAVRPDETGNWLITWANNYQPDGQLEMQFPINPVQIIFYPRDLAVYTHNFNWSSVATISTGFPQTSVPAAPSSRSWLDTLKKIFFTFFPKF